MGEFFRRRPHALRVPRPIELFLFFFISLLRVRLPPYLGTVGAWIQLQSIFPGDAAAKEVHVSSVVVPTSLDFFFSFSFFFLSLSLS